MNLSTLTGRYGVQRPNSKAPSARSDAAIALDCVVHNVGHTRTEIVVLLRRRHGLTETRARLALKTLRDRGDIECEEGLCQATVQGMLR